MPTTLVVSANGSRARLFMQPTGCESLDEVHDVSCAEGERLAHSVAAYIGQAHEAEAFTRLVVIGSEEFRRRLRERLAQPVASTVESEIDGDYTHLSGEQLAVQLQRCRKTG